jgi:hypothetical protein
MNVMTDEFLLSLSDDWHVEQGGGRVVAHDEEQREIIVSVTSVFDGGSSGAHTSGEVRAMIIEHTLEAARSAASHSDLDTLEELAALKETALPVWRVRCISKDRQVFFAQLVFAGINSVGLLTFEALAGAESEARFEAIQKGLRPR